MPRLSDALAPASTVFLKGTQSATVNPLRGGQFGFSQDQAGWVNNAQHIRSNLICQVLEAPTIMTDHAEATYLIGMLKCIWELHAQEITGLNRTLTAEFAETPFGGGGQMQEDITDVKEGRINLRCKLNEKYGMPFHKYLAWWIRTCGMDPNSKIALINTTTANRITDLLPDRATATLAFYEPDPTHTKVVQSWIIPNVFPKSAGDVEGVRNLTQGKEALNYDIEWTGFGVTGAGVDALCQRLLDNIDISGANPYNRAAFLSRIDPNVMASQVGYAQGIEQLIRENVAP